MFIIILVGIRNPITGNPFLKRDSPGTILKSFTR